MHSSYVSTSRFKRFLFPTALTFSTLLLGQQAFAAVIYQDDFDRANSNTVGSTWSEIENQSNDVAIYRNQLRLRDQSELAQDAAALLDLGLDNYQDLSLSFDWRATNSTEASDTLYLGWNDSNGWESVWTQSLGGSDYATVEVDLSALTPSTGHRLGFWIDVSSATETVYLDNLLLEGELLTNSTPDPVATVSEPNTSLLLSLGLMGLLYRSKSMLKLKKT